MREGLVRARAALVRVAIGPHPDDGHHGETAIGELNVQSSRTGIRTGHAVAQKATGPESDGEHGQGLQTVRHVCELQALRRGEFPGPVKMFVHHATHDGPHARTAVVDRGAATAEAHHGIAVLVQAPGVPGAGIIFSGPMKLGDCVRHSLTK